MSKTTASDFTTILLRWGVLSAEQLAEGRRLSAQTGVKLQQMLVRLEYTTEDQVLRAVAESHRLPCIDLTAVTIPAEVIELVPESVARENIVLPLGAGGGALFLVLSDPDAFDTIQKLQFILNRAIHPVLALREQIIDAINRHYGQSETESVDSMLSEFTDSAIDFTETEMTADFDLGYCAEQVVAMDLEADVPRRQRGRPVGRQATVRYYHRINPERTYPLLVILSDKQIREIAKRNVGQASSGRFEVALDSGVDVEPILPGCSCYPPKDVLTVREGETSATFWVVPHVLGKVMQPRVVVRQNGKVLAEVPLQVRVVKQGLTLVLAALSLVLPPILLLLKQLRLDFESQLQDNFGLYAQAAQWALRSLTPEWLVGLLLLATAGAYLWLRPRRRDVFWDVEVAGSETSAETPAAEEVEEDAREPNPDVQVALFREAERLFVGEVYHTALGCYERGLRRGKAPPAVYFRASLAASYCGDDRRALAILEEAAAALHPARVSGAMWYNMGCFCARLGRLAEAVRYLNRAADAGYADPAKYLHDPDLAPLRCRADFKRLLGSLQEC
jgi:type II secretion system (T2SS) protein E